MKNKNIMIVLAVFFDLFLSFLFISFEGCADNNVVLCVMTCSLAMTYVLKKPFLSLRHTKRFIFLNTAMFVSFLFLMKLAVNIGGYAFVKLEIFLFFIGMIFFFLPILSLKDLIKKDFGVALFISEELQKRGFLISGIFEMLAFKNFGLVLRIAEQTTDKILKFGKQNAKYKI
ncbi:hypothetical protein LO80_00230 [Candidatus Francisella endociliophora]|uniref:Uncharacterized protein n=1 Tax=Candidatus Francisella endociliophora TaxID=653937 RepID=A0A097ELV4_9GAMM|nr:hypothetical protein [Francisella sp. FSC1006]AIT08550.1 hypothetical protein LO80_00230 [Francisella sp. FSC1006]